MENANGQNWELVEDYSNQSVISAFVFENTLEYQKLHLVLNVEFINSGAITVHINGDAFQAEHIYRGAYVSAGERTIDCILENNDEGVIVMHGEASYNGVIVGVESTDKKLRSFPISQIKISGGQMDIGGSFKLYGQR